MKRIGVMDKISMLEQAGLHQFAREVADDAQPATPEWLESVGFIDGGPRYVSFDDESDWTLNWLPETGEWFIQYHPYGGEPANFPLPNVTTRGDVRHLVRMLGGELKE